jgi:hypothetical protein
VTAPAKETAAPSTYIITEPGVYDLTEAEYHADPVDPAVGGSLSSTGARTIITSSPARYLWDRDHGRPDTRAFDAGRAAHREVLGAGGDVVVIEGSGKRPNAWDTTETKAAVAEARAAGKTPIRPHDAETVAAMADALRTHPIAGPLLARPGRAEQSFVGRDPESGVMCRIRVDWLPDVPANGRVLAVDYKTTTDASPHGFAASMARYGYHQQGPFYCDVLSWLDLDNGRPPLFVLVAQEKDPPYLVTVNTLTERAVEWGRVLNRKARDIYRHCTETGLWPGYDPGPTGIAELDLPGWQIARYEAALDAGLFDLIGDTTS